MKRFLYLIILLTAVETNAYAQLGAIGGIASIQGKSQTTFPLFTLTAKTGQGGMMDTGFYVYYAQVDRYLGKDIWDEFSGNPRERLIYKILNASYNITSDMNLSMSIPYVSFDWGQTNLTTNAFYISNTGGGLSNPAIRLMYQFLKAPMLAVYGTVYLPTGFEQVGSEGTDIEIDLAYTKELGIVQWDSNAGYRYTGRQPSTNTKQNNIIVANTAFSIPLGLSFSGFFELNWMYGGNVENLANNTTILQWKLDLVPGIRVSITPKLFFTASMKYAPYDSFILGYHYIYVMGLDYLML